jgi:hypothetical protein
MGRRPRLIPPSTEDHALGCGLNPDFTFDGSIHAIDARTIAKIAPSHRTEPDGELMLE